MSMVKHISEIKQSVEEVVQQYVEKAATVFDTSTLPPSPKKLDRTPSAPLQLPDSACSHVKYTFQKVVADLKNLQTLANAEQFNQQAFIEEITLTLDAWENFFSSHFTEEINQMVTKLKVLKNELEDDSGQQHKSIMAELSERMKKVGAILKKAVLVREKITKSGMEIEQMKLAGNKSQESLNAVETAHMDYIQEQERKITEVKENLRLVQLLKAKNADFLAKEMAASQAISGYSSSFEEAIDKGNALGKEIARRFQQVEEDGDLPAPLQAMRFLIAHYPIKE
ncbi:unnamed protein product [Urochloa decumbens]|uniref:Uncharacterized protein n=1 Tax=Urochloa decumbens TaxID=240449 RepID=A0ABC8VDG2_9POAL